MVHKLGEERLRAPLTIRAMGLLYDHLNELRGLLARLEPDHPARERIAAKIAECEEAMNHE